MLFGSTARPIVLTAGAAAVLALGGATIPLTALASSDSGSAEPAPEASTSESPAPSPSDNLPSDPPPVVDPPPPVVDPPSGGGATTPAPPSSITLSPSPSRPRSPNRRAAVVGLGAPGTRALPFTAPGSGLPAAPGILPGAAVQPQLPLIGQPPAVAPKLGQPGTPTALRAASSRLGMDDTTFRLVLTQVAWLSALLVFMSVLLTQIRLRRRR